MRLLVLGPSEGWHADQLRQAAAKRNVSIEFADYGSLQCSVEKQTWRASGAAKSDFATTDPPIVRALDADLFLARTMPYGTLDQITFRLAVLHAWQAARVDVINPPRTLEIAIDKFATLTYAAQAGWSVPQTIICQDRIAAMDAFDRLQGDVVVKPLLGSEGHGVFRLTDRQLAWTAFTTLERLGQVLYVQQFIGPGGRDLRILIWGKHRFAVRRENASDWRTNVSRGGISRVSQVPAELEPLANRLADSLGLFYGAMDIAEDANGKPYFLEVNAVPGWKGAESALNADLAQLLVDELIAR